MEGEDRGFPVTLGTYYLPQTHIVHKGLAEWLTSGHYLIRGYMRVHLVNLPTSRLLGFTITPDLVKRLDFERVECPKCGERFVVSEADLRRSPSVS